MLTTAIPANGLQLYHKLYAVGSAVTATSELLVMYINVLVVQWLNVGLVIERSLVRLPAGVLSSQLGQLSLLSLRVGKLSTGLYGWV